MFRASASAPSSQKADLGLERDFRDAVASSRNFNDAMVQSRWFTNSISGRMEY